MENTQEKRFSSEVVSSQSGRRVSHVKTDARYNQTSTGRAMIFDSQSCLSDFLEAEIGPLDENFSEGDRWRGMARPGQRSFDQINKSIRFGNDENVSKSDDLLAQFEDIFDFNTKKLETVRSVAGGMAHIPSMLAGAPNSMITKRRTMKEGAPLTLIIDLCMSAAISADDMLKRGIALLSFARMAATVRPVKIWVVGGMLPDSSDKAFEAMAFPIDSQPLDLARACQAISEVSMLRTVQFAVTCWMAGQPGDQYIKWPYNAKAKYDARIGPIWRSLLNIPDTEDILAVTGAHCNDKLVQQPVEWIKDNIEKYGLASNVHDLNAA